MKKLVFCIAAAGFVLVGCAGNSPAPPPQRMSMTVPYSDADFGSWAGIGNADIQGQAFLKTVGGDVKTCAGQNVVLAPDNSYSRELLMVMVVTNGKVPTNADNRATRYMRLETCDSQGAFSFKNLKPNKWIILTKVLWAAPIGYSLKQQGGIIEKSITAAPGENRMILTDADAVVIAQ